jgi:hypothetical protein
MTATHNALLGALSRHSHFDEFSEPINVRGNILTPAQRQALARTNLGAASAEGLATEAGPGIVGTAAAYAASVVKEGDLIKTTILIDIAGLNGGGTAGDIIGLNGSGAAYIGQITAARNGTIIAGRVTCLEVPTTSDPDVDLWAADEATGVEDTAISALTNETQLTNNGDHTLARVTAFIAMPAANQYLYLTGGDATAGTYGAGIFLIEMWGLPA